MKRPVLVQVSLFVVLGLLATAFGVRYVCHQLVPVAVACLLRMS